MGADTITKNPETIPQNQSVPGIKTQKTLIDIDTPDIRTASGLPARVQKDNWDKLAAVAPIISGMLIFLMGGCFTYAFNQQQLRLQEIQTIEKFIPHLMGNEQSKKAAILAMSQLTNPQLAGRFAAIFASTGTVSALQTMAENGNAQEKNMATKALSDALESLAARESKLTDIEAAYQNSLQAKSKDPGADPDYIHNLSQLGEVYKLRGQVALAEPILKKSLQIREKLYGSENPQVADALRSLAELYQMNGNKIEADICLKRARAMESKFATQKTDTETAQTAREAAVAEPDRSNTEKTPNLASEQKPQLKANTTSSTQGSDEKKIRYVDPTDEQKTN